MDQDRTKRKLTAIFSADVVGYSRLMEADEAWTIQSLEENKKLISALIEEYEGRVIDAPGDNLLAEFNSVINAVECAVKIQQKLKKKNDHLIESNRMHFRIGINLGDVVEEDGRIYGNGVNIAARLEGLTDPGGICISRRTYDVVKTRLDLGYEYLGEHTVKNIAEPVRVYRVLMGSENAGKVIGEKKASKMVSRRLAVSTFIVLIIIAAGSLIWNIYSNQSRKIEQASESEQATAIIDVTESPKTMAVLPFTNLSSDPEQEYFVDGLCEELLNFLAKIPELSVTSRTSAFSFKDKDMTVQEIASVLGVGHILEGSVRKAGNTLRVTAQLIRAADDSHLWSDQYDRELKDIEDILSIQEDIAKAVANELKLKLGVGESLKQLGGTDNEKAYELYLSAKGQYSGSIGRPTIDLLEPINAALALDPNFALAWTLKAEIISSLSIEIPANQYNAMIDEQTKAIQKAIEIEPNLPEIYVILGDYKLGMGEWTEAKLNYRKASELTAEPSLKYKAFSLFQYFAVGDFNTALINLEAWRKNDPLNPVTRGFYISTLGLSGNLDQAEEEYELGKAMFGNDWFWGNIHIALIRIVAGDMSSRDEVKKLWPVDQNPLDQIVSPEDALVKLQKFYDNNNLSSFQLQCTSICAAYFGEPEFALDAIVKSIMLEHTNTTFLWYPVMHEVRQLPRFKEFLREIGLVDYWNEFGWPDTCRPLDHGDFECD